MLPYFLVGNGRLSRHFQHYFSLEGLDFDVWHRSSAFDPEPLITGARRILVLIPDDAIEGFVQQYLPLRREGWIHCSGVLRSDFAESQHPLMSFSETLFPLETYRSIPFVWEQGRSPFQEVFGELQNPNVAIKPEDKALYHALCVLGGNGSTMLWQKVIEVAGKRLGLAPEFFGPFARQSISNLLTEDAPLTGPLVRGDQGTIEKNLGALSGDVLEEIYRVFSKAFATDPLWSR